MNKNDFRIEIAILEGKNRQTLLAEKSKLKS